jgi:beta-lactam-binding protein with PASTA domain/tRNA A-37 threonylcarbamoyl transferase component Bud32
VAGGSTTSSPVVDDALAGRLLDGRYRLDEAIARGGMATVYRATDTRLDRVVAVKVMRPALAEDPEFVDRFTREAKAAARLSSPEVVAVHDQGTDPATATAYLVMEYVAGRTLRDLLLERGALPPSRALQLFEPVLRALAAAHSAGLVHRDVKPENVLLADDGRVKVADFGLARAVETSSLTATTGLLIGTVAYLAPEQVEHGSSDTRTDVYAAGILLWELLTGAPPYSSDSPLSVAYRHVHEDVPPPSRLVEGIPTALDELVVRATRRDPAARPVDAGAFLAEVRDVRKDVGDPSDTLVLRRDAGHPTLVVEREAVSAAAAADPAPAAKPSSPDRGRRGLVWGLVLSVLAAAVLAGGWWFTTGRYTDMPPVLGLAEAEAVAVLEQAGFDVEVDPEQQFSEEVPAGQVLDQRPGPNERAVRESTVTIVLSKGPDRRAVPELGGMDQATAEETLNAVGLRLGAVTRDFSEAPVGTVIRTDPFTGTELRPNASVAIVLSKGVEMLPVPGVVGRTAAAAAAALEEAGFTSSSTEVFSETAEKGTVVAQDPAAGTAPRGSTVALQVSKGPQLITVPDLSGKPRDEAEAALRALGLSPRVVAIPGPGTVRSTRPGAGSQVRKGSEVTLFVF